MLPIGMIPAKVLIVAAIGKTWMMWWGYLVWIFGVGGGMWFLLGSILLDWLWVWEMNGDPYESKLIQCWVWLGWAGFRAMCVVGNAGEVWYEGGGC